MKLYNLGSVVALLLLVSPSTVGALDWWDAFKDGETMRRVELTTRMNAYLVQAAVESFAEHNNGMYPVTVWIGGADGLSVIDFLPGGELLLNSYTLARTEPVDGSAATPGQIGHLVIVDACGNNSGYDINAWGGLGEVVAISRIGSPDLCPEPADAEASADASEPNDPGDSSE